MQTMNIETVQTDVFPHPSGLGILDLGIIGGGPAGSLAAFEAVRRGLRVVLWDRDRFPRDKVCGEFLSPESIPLLSEIIPDALRCAAVIRRAEFYSRKGRTFSISFPQPGLGLSRVALDSALWRAAQMAGADCRQGEAIRGIRRKFHRNAKRGVWEVYSRAGICEVRRPLIACGRWWRLEGLSSPADSANSDRAGKWMGAKAHFRGIAAQDCVEMYFFPGGYCGLAPIEKGLCNVCCLIHRSITRERGGAEISDFAGWLSRITRHPALESRLRGAVQATETLATSPVRPARRRADEAGALFVGDAAGFLDPFTGDGISIALQSGRLAAKEAAAADASAPASQVARRYRRKLARSVRRNYVIAALLRSVVRAPAELQNWIAAVMPARLGPRLLRETRWRATAAL
jgi:flavin-dependent dehydrogenase